MKRTITESDFHDAFVKMGRENNFSYDGRAALFNMLEEMESDGNEQELDIIALCCDFSEYENIEDFWQSYDKEDYPDMDSINDATFVIMIDEESFIVQDF